MNILINWLISALAVGVAAYVLPGVSVDGLFPAMVVVVVLALVNVLVKPIFVLLTLPVTIFSLGLFMLVINAFVVLLVDFLVSGFHVSSFWSALGFSISLWLINLVFGKNFKNN